MDKLMHKVLKERQQRDPTAKFRKYFGNGHYDWSYVQQQQKIRQKRGFRSGNGNKYVTTSNKIDSDGDGDDEYEYEYVYEYDVSFNSDVITFLRHPVSRAISQFYFSQTMRWARIQNASFIHMTLEEYLVDPKNSGFADPIVDGLGGVTYLAGTSSSSNFSWIGSDGNGNGIDDDSDEYESSSSPLKRSLLRRTKTASCLRAARRLDQTTWFGLLEDVDRSMKLLQITMDLDRLPVLPMSNAGAQKRRSRPSSSSSTTILSKSKTISTLEGYLPQDIWLYEYAKRLFEARWDYFTNNNEEEGEVYEYVHPDLPPLPID